MGKPEATYTTFEELTAYARQRALISANRNGHQEFAYWVSIAEWANSCANHNVNVRFELNATLDCLRYRDDYVNPIQDAATDYARAVHLRRMLVNRGDRVPRLSLDWLREEAEMLQESEVEAR